MTDAADNTAAYASRPGRDALVAWAIVLGVVAAVVRIDITLPLIGHLGSALVAVAFLYAPVVVAWRRHEDLADYGFVLEPVRKGAITAGVTIAVIFPVFVVAYVAFYEVACGSSTLAHLAPRGLCSHYAGLSAMHVALSKAHEQQTFVEFALVQLVVVALPEELFFRGCLLKLLEQRFPPKRRILGGGIGVALVLSAAAFALVHLPKDGDPRALATFFPGLLFGWMRSSTGSIFASTVTHAGSNVLIRILEASVLR